MRGLTLWLLSTPVRRPLGSWAEIQGWVAWFFPAQHSWGRGGIVGGAGGDGSILLSLPGQLHLK